MANKDPHNQRIKYNEEDATLFKEHKCTKLLEIFFGDGRNLLAFHNEGFEVVGIDDGKQQHHDYISSGKTALEATEIKTVIAPVFEAKLPFEDNSFEGVYAWHYINHNHKEKIEDVFKEIYRILKSKGIFSLRITKMEDFKYEMIDDEHATTIASAEELAHGLGPEKIKILGPQTFSRFVKKESGIPHYAYYKEELQKSLEAIGFHNIKIESVLWNWHVWCEK